MSFVSLRYERHITWNRVLTSRTPSTSFIQREVIHAQGQSGSNQKSAYCDTGATSLGVTVESAFLVGLGVGRSPSAIRVTRRSWLSAFPHRHARMRACLGST